MGEVNVFFPPLNFCHLENKYLQWFNAIILPSIFIMFLYYFYFSKLLKIMSNTCFDLYASLKSFLFTYNYEKELSLCYKLLFPNFYIFGTKCCRT